MTRTLRMLKRRASTLSLGLAAATLCCAPAGAQDDARAQEQATKAAMIYNFSRFTQWPDSRFTRPDDPVVVCIDPSDPLTTSLASIDGKPLDGRTLVVRRTSRIDHGCTMAYVSAASASDSHLESLKQAGVLTIGETPRFSRAGAIQLITIGRQVRFEVNPRNAADAGAHLSSNLMRLAVAVR